MATESAEEVTKLAADLVGRFQAEKEKLDRIDQWARWDHEDPYKPRQATAEFNELVARSEVPWGDLIVTSAAQMLYVGGYRRADSEDNATPWRIWQANQMDRRQIPLHRSTLTYGRAYELVLPGKSLTGEPIPSMRGLSPRQMLAFFDDIAVDDWPIYAVRVITKRDRKVEVRVYDDRFEHVLDSVGEIGDKLGYRTQNVHGAGVCPVVQFTNRFDLEGRSAGEIEPFIPLLGRIDQTSFDRLVVQRFASWVVRTVSGLDVPETAAVTGQTTEQVKMNLRVEDFLIASDTDTSFGTLAATPLDGFIAAHDADTRVLAAVSQTPAHELLGQMANLSAEALAAAKASQTAKADEHKMTLGEHHAQALRLGAHLYGDQGAADDFEAQVRWKDTSIRSLAQAADALGKLATMLGFPPELLWEKIPGIDQLDVERAKKIVADGGGIEQALRTLIDGQTSAPEAFPPAA